MMMKNDDADVDYNRDNNNNNDERVSKYVMSLKQSQKENFKTDLNLEYSFSQNLSL